MVSRFRVWVGGCGDGSGFRICGFKVARFIGWWWVIVGEVEGVVVVVD